MSSILQFCFENDVYFPVIEFLRYNGAILRDEEVADNINNFWEMTKDWDKELIRVFVDAITESEGANPEWLDFIVRYDLVGKREVEPDHPGLNSFWGDISTEFTRNSQEKCFLDIRPLMMNTFVVNPYYISDDKPEQIFLSQMTNPKCSRVFNECGCDFHWYYRNMINSPENFINGKSGHGVLDMLKKARRLIWTNDYDCNGLEIWKAENCDEFAILIMLQIGGGEQFGYVQIGELYVYLSRQYEAHGPITIDCSEYYDYDEGELKTGMGVTDMYTPELTLTNMLTAVCPDLAERWNTDDIEEIQRLIDEGAFIEARDANGFTPLKYAAMYGRNYIVKTLLGAGARVNSEREYDSPLHIACRRGYYEICVTLLDAGADIEKETDNYTYSGEKTPIFYAARDKHSEVVKLLIERGANYKKRGERSCMNVLDIARYNEDRDLVKYIEGL